MLEERLHKIIGSIQLQISPSPEHGMALRGADEVNISLTELMILASVFSDEFPEEVKSFAEALSAEMQKISTPGLSTQEKANREITAAELLESNKDPISYLNSINRILIRTDDGQIDSEQLKLSLNIPRNQEFSFRDDYIEKLAEAYARGNNSNSIQYLLKTYNSVFNESLGFIENVKTAIILTERDQLKKKMQLLDELETFDLSESAVKAGIILSERERLKERMMKIDKEQANASTHLRTEHPSAAARAPIVPALTTSFEKNRFTWKRFAVAASLVGLIAISSLLLYNDKKSHFNMAGNDPMPADTNENLLPGSEKTNTVLANHLLDTTETIQTIRKEEVMGFAAKQEKITVRVYRITGKISVTSALQKQADSLLTLNKMYSFKNNNLSFYTTGEGLPELYKIDNRYYLEMNDSLYQFPPSNKLSLLISVADRNISDRINKIKYQQGNK